MKSFRGVLSRLDSIPVNGTWMLQSIAEKRGHQDLYTRQSPEKLRKLREYAIIESAVASNRISTHHLLNANSTGLRTRVGEIDYLILGDINKV